MAISTTNAPPRMCKGYGSPFMSDPDSFLIRILHFVVRQQEF
jgi:hypothetical protein